jgi:diguanylate cyclase (GGDEF)-like protein
LWSTLAVGLPIAAWCVAHLDLTVVSRQDLWALGLLGVLVVFGETRPLIASKTYGQGGVTPSTAFTFAILFTWGLVPAVVFHCVGSLLADLIERKVWWKLVFNLGQYTVSLTCAWLALMPLGWQASLADPHTFSRGDLGAMLLAWTVYFMVNNGLVSYLVGLYNGQPFRDVFFEDFGYQVFTNVAVLSFSGIVTMVIAAGPEWLPLVLPGMVAIYATAGMALDREHQANHDSLTSLPNRKLLVEQLGEALQQREDGQSVALFVLDLDRFKEVNDTLGHQTGDQLLRIVSERLRDAVRPADTVARLGGDEFAVLLSGIRDEESALDVARRIGVALAEPFQLDGMLLELEASVGVALAPQHGTDVEQLMRCADIAMYVAKDERTAVETYAASRDRHSANRLGLLGSLRRGIDEGELELHYQPKVSLSSGSVTGVEALVRWRHPQRGLVFPDDFVPLAEHSGLMHRLTAHVIDTALAQAAEWWSVGLQVPVAVNVSARDLHGPALAQTVASGLARHDLPASALRLELTERVLMAEPARVGETVAALQRLGVRLSLDDFGTGYSSLVLLQQMPVAEIKVDRSFVSRLASGGEGAIVRSIIDLAHALGIEAVAEGVETEETWSRLEELGCDSAQGWYVSRPMASGPATDWLLRHPSRRAALRVLRTGTATAGA